MAQIAGPKALHVQHLVSWTTRGIRNPKENNTSGEDQAILLGHIMQLYFLAHHELAGDLWQ